MSISDHDLFALRNYSFAVNKTSAFFTITTLLMSFLIVSLSILINWKTVSHLWLPRHELDITSSTKIALPQTLTSTLFCYQPYYPQLSQQLPSIKLLSDSFEQLPFKFLAEAEIAHTNPKLKEFIGTGFGCIDIQGVSLTQMNQNLFFEINCSAVTVFLIGATQRSFIYDEWVEPMTDYAFNIFGSSTMGIYITFFEGILKEKLDINYEPEKIFTIRKVNNPLQKMISIPQPKQNHCYYAVKVFEPNQIAVQSERNFNLQTVTVERLDIGSILGAVLSWTSALAFLFGCIAVPIMEICLNLHLIETIFHLSQQNKRPSLLKYLIASIKSGIFEKQDKFIKMNKQLVKLKNIGFILKAQFLFRRITHNVSQQNEEMFICEPIFGDTKQDFCAQTFTDQIPKQSNFFEAEDDKASNTLINLRQKLLKLFDVGSDFISVNFEGKGIGSTLSASLTMFFMLGLLTFFFLFGVFSTSTTATDLEVISNDFTYSIEKDQIFITVPFTRFYEQPTFYFMDGNYEKLGVAPVISSPLCNSRLLNKFNVNPGIYFVFCLNESITLKSSNKKSQRIFLFCEIKMNSQVRNVMVYQQSSISKDKQFFPYVKNTDFFLQDYSQQYREISIKKSTFKNSTDEVSYGQYLTMSQPISTQMRTKNRSILFKLVPNQRIITVSTTTFFDMVQNIWSFTTVGISFVLAKVAKHINLKRKEKVMSSLKVKYRENIFVLLSKISGLLEGRNKEEIQRMKYYIKAPYQS